MLAHCVQDAGAGGAGGKKEEQRRPLIEAFVFVMFETAARSYQHTLVMGCRSGKRVSWQALTDARHFKNGR